MRQLLAVWLVPQDNDKEYLQKIVNDLGEKYNAPLFVPHLTILGDTLIELKDLKQAIDKAFENIKPITIKKTQISQSNIFFKTVFIELEENEMLASVFENLKNNLPEKTDYVFKPHISLLYKIMPEEEKIKIVKNLNIKSEFIIDKVVVNAPKNGDTDFLNIEGWQSLYVKDLNN